MIEYIILKLKCHNAAFVDDNCGEIAKILREYANNIEKGAMPERLFDINGNSVGVAEYQIAERNATP